VFGWRASHAIGSPFWLDRRSLGAFRIALGLTLLCDLIKFRWLNIDAFYSDTGILVPSDGGSLFPHGPAWTHLFFFCTAIVYASYAVGYRARLMGLLSLISLWSIHERTPVLVATDDQALICLLAWSLFLPIGDRFSIRPRPSEPNPTHSIATVGIVLQVAAIYFFNAYPKTGWTWGQGVALSFALIEDLWAYAPTASWLAQFHEFCRWATALIRPIEFSVAFLIVSPLLNGFTRLLAALLILCFHWSIFLFISLGFFPMITSAWALLLLPSRFWDAWLGGRRTMQDQSWWPVDGRRSLTACAAGLLVVMTWQNLLYLDVPWIDRLGSPLPTRIASTSLLRQYWALYAPDATIDSRWIKVRGVTAAGEPVDAWSGRPFTYDNLHLSPYQTEPWQNLAYHRLYGVFDVDFTGRWARFELERWNQRFPGRRLRRAEIVAFERRIVGPERTTPIKWRVLSAAGY
jgi:Vitamin K-dependent gamma-carboxylase